MAEQDLTKIKIVITGASAVYRSLPLHTLFFMFLKSLISSYYSYTKLNKLIVSHSKCIMLSKISNLFILDD